MLPLKERIYMDIVNEFGIEFEVDPFINEEPDEVIIGVGEYNENEQNKRTDD